jgi:hypothetical protein
MKKLIKNVLIAAFTAAVLFSACKKEDDPAPINLVANAGPDQFVKPLDEVLLDGSKSSANVGFTYSWKYTGIVPEEDINFQNTTTATPTFVATENGLYTFSLTISAEGQKSEDVVIVTASGALGLGGTLTQDTVLTNIENDPELPDYLLGSDLIIPEGITLTIEENVRIQINSELGIVVNGTLTNASNGQYFEDVEFSSTNGWKGILVDGGVIDLSDVIIEKAGASIFDGQEEAAAILFTGEPSQIIKFDRNEFRNSFSYDILGESEISGYETVTSNIFSFSIPIKARMSFMDLFFSDEKNVFPQDYQYIQLIPNDIEAGDKLPDNHFYFFYHRRYYFDGSFRSLSEAYSTGGITFFMKENASLIFEKTTGLGSNYSETSAIVGINGSSWNGIAATNETNLKINNVNISNAGAAPVVGGPINSQVKAVVYMQGRASGWLHRVTITDSQGYGLYINSADDALNTFQIQNSTFQNTQNAAIRISAKSVTNILEGNLFELDESVPGCLVEQDGSPGDVTWRALSNSYYLIDAELSFNITGSIVFQPGVHLKFKSGRFFNWNLGYNGVLLSIEGNVDNPVIFEGENDEPGSWGGMVLNGSFNINYMQVKNGGEFLLPNASIKGNIYFDFTDFGTSDFFKTFNNGLISGSSGYGVVLSNGAIEYDFEDPAKNNTFINNALGNVIRE